MATPGGPVAGPVFDRVQVTLATGETQTLSRPQYELLPLDVRVRALFAKNLKFFLGAVEVPARDALKDRR